MKIIKAGYEILSEINGEKILKNIEKVARTCYKSEDLIKQDSAIKLIANLIKREHYAMIEHENLSVKFICDRGVSHEIVRHRVASYAQESTRYCNYSGDKFGNEITVIKPYFFDIHSAHYGTWEIACRQSEKAYFELLENGATPQEARSILPNSLKTEIVMTTNLREWRHFFQLRTDKTAHPQMKEITIPLLKELQNKIPLIFDDIEVEV